MTAGPFFANDPIGLTLAADQHFGISDPSQDIVWQLLISDSSHLSLYSTLGLQAQSFHFFPQFCLNKSSRSDVCDFFSAPRLAAVYSNYARLITNPFEELEATLEVWVKTGALLFGRIRITNHSAETVGVDARLAAKLVSLRGSSDLKHTRIGDKTFLKGQSGNLTVNLTFDGPSRILLSPSLGLEQGKQLSPGKTLTVLWQAQFQSDSKDDPVDPSVQFPSNWDAEIARLNIANQARIVQINTPMADWDAVLYSSQNQAFQLLSQIPGGSLEILNCRSLHTASFATLNGNGFYRIKPTPAPELWQLVMTLLPAQPELAAEIFSSYLSTALEKCGNSNNGELPFPCLVQLGWKIHQHFQEKTYLEAIYPALLNLLRCWFNPRNDRDQDGVPEWNSLQQSGLESLRSFDLTDESSLPTQINFTESIGLASLLISELEILQKFAAILEQEEDLHELSNLIQVLRKWTSEIHQKNLQSGLVDYQSHEVYPSQLLFEGELADFGHKPLHLTHPARLNIRLKPQLQLKKPTSFSIIGVNNDGNQVEEVIYTTDLIWLPGSFFVTTREIYTRLDRFEGLNLEDTRLQIHAADLHTQDISQLFCDLEVQNELVEDDGKSKLNIQDLLSSTNYGLPESLHVDEPTQVVNLSWNCLLVSHLVEIGERELAFKLFSQLMAAQVGMLKADHTASDRWHAQTGRNLGSSNSIGSLIPVNLFLEIAGVRIFHENKVIIQGSNPLPWAFKVFYRGLEVARDGKNTTICFPNGDVEHHFGSSPKTFTRIQAVYPDS